MRVSLVPRWTRNASKRGIVGWVSEAQPTTFLPLYNVIIHFT
jgi:hypothetical protein